MDATRRGFLRGGFLTEEGRSGIARQALPLGPPPPWHRGHLRQETCTACDQACARACEVGVIAIHEEGHPLAGLPYLHFEAAGCTYCGDCLSACPMDLDEQASTTRPQIGLVVLDTARCLAWNGVICMSCQFACPERAIHTDRQGRPAIEPAPCTGCGQCLAPCPQQAIHWSHPAPQPKRGDPLAGPFSAYKGY